MRQRRVSEFPFSDGSIQCISWGEDTEGFAGDQARFEPSFKSRVFRMAVERVGVDQFLPLRPLNLLFGDEVRHGFNALWPVVRPADGPPQQSLT